MSKNLIGQEVNQEQSQNEKPKNKGGRPRVFKTPEEMQVLLDEYFEIKSGHTRKMVLKNGAIVEVPDPEPVSIAGICAYLGITYDTLSEYQKLDGFSVSITQAKLICEEFAVNMCFKGKNKADFVLQNNFGWRNRSTSENKTENTTKIVYIDKEEKAEYEKHIDAVINGNDAFVADKD